MTKFFHFAVAAAVATSAIALYDAAHHGVTGQYSEFSDDSTVPVLAQVGGVVHGLNYAALTAILVVLARAATTTRAQRLLSWLLAVALGVLAVSFLVIDPIAAVTGQTSAAPLGAFSNVTGVAFLLMFLLAFLLGLTLRRRPEFRVPAVLLVGVGPVILLTVLAGALGSGFAHPAYVETLVNLGVVLLAVPTGLAHRASSSLVRQVPAPV
jgi:hypothetical protein